MSATNAQQSRAHSARPIPDLAILPDDALLTRQHVSDLSTMSLASLKLYAKQGRGPKVTRIEGLPRYRVADVREWLTGKS